MKFIKYIFTVIVFAVSFQVSVAQHHALQHISEKEMERHLFFLASDSLQGRGFGTEVPGLEITADYLKRNLKKMGLTTAEDEYHQSFDIISYRPDKQNTFLEIYNNKGKEKTHQENIAALNQQSEMIDFSGEVVFAGFGLQDSAAGYNDFKGLDMKEKIVLYSAGTPESFSEGVSGKWDNPVENKKTKQIFEAGAKAIILTTSLQDKENSTFRQLERWANNQNYTLDPGHKKDDKKIIVITPEVAGSLLGSKRKWKKQLRSISKKNTPNSFVLKNRKVHVQSARIKETVNAQNVWGVVEGSDPELKDECVVFMAHYDHLGTSDNGEIFNGADDNATGVVTLLELAKTFSRLREKPKRSIVFLWPTAEEVGLIGSEYYSKNPAFPLKNTVACINLDMVGRVYEARDSVWNHSPKQVKDFNGIYALVNDIDPRLKETADSVCARLGLNPDYSLPASFFNTSDHYHFHRNDVPVLNFSTGYSADYHKTTDEATRIRFDKMKRVAELCFLVGLEVANKKNNDK